MLICSMNLMVLFCFVSHNWAIATDTPLKNKLQQKIYPQINGFNGTITSGPIIIIDKKTLLIPNFSTSSYGIFNTTKLILWIGDWKSKFKTIQLLENNDDTAQDKTYFRQNVYFKILGNINIESGHYSFGIIDEQDGLILGESELNITIPVAPVNSTESLVVRLPKCCPMDNVLSKEGVCAPLYNGSMFYEFNMFRHNSTHIFNKSLDVSEYSVETYYYPPICSMGKFPLYKDDDMFGFLTNGSLFLVDILQYNNMQSPGDFCIDGQEENPSEVVVFICYKEDIVAPSGTIRSIFWVYISCMILSTFCYLLSSALSYFDITKIFNHKMYFLGFSFGMSILFFLLILSQFIEINCNAFGHVLAFFINFSVIFCIIMCLDFYWHVKVIQMRKKHSLEETSTRSRQEDDNPLTPRTAFRDKKLRCFIGIPLLISTLFLMLSIWSTPIIPSIIFKPQFGRNTCRFQSNWKNNVVYVFYGLSFLTCFILKLISLQILPPKNHALTYIYRRNSVLVFLMGVWLTFSFIEIPADSQYFVTITVLESIQGVFFLCLFAFNPNNREKVQCVLENKSKFKPTVQDTTTPLRSNEEE